jgi:predicted Fe-S protein YdhL (DUF1289 family)
MIDQRTSPSPKSPCISHCIIDTDNGFCEGCWRTLDEVSAWRTMQDTTKLAILELLKVRRLAAGQTAK